MTLVLSKDLTTFKAEYEYVHEVIAKMQLLYRGLGSDIVDQWRVAADDPRIIDVGTQAWVVVQRADDGGKEVPSHLADWVCLWNPYMVDLVLDVLRSHVEGMNEIYETRPDLDGLRVSPKVMRLADMLQTYMISQETKNEEGEWMTPRRRLLTSEWEEDL